MNEWGKFQDFLKLRRIWGALPKFDLNIFALQQMQDLSEQDFFSAQNGLVIRNSINDSGLEPLRPFDFPCCFSDQ